MKRWSYIENYVNFSHSTSPEPPFQLNLSLSILERPYLFPKKDNAELKSPSASWYANTIPSDARVYSLWYLGAC